MKRILKVCLIVLLAVVIVIGGFILSLTGSYAHVKTDIDQYDNDIRSVPYAIKFMPDLETLDGYTGIEYTHKINCDSMFMGFFSDGFALFTTYDDSNYDTIKTRVLSEYSFLEEPVMSSDDTYELPVTEFEYKGFHMKVVPDDGFINSSACKSFMLLGFNDEEHKIVYLYYYHPDIDYIAKVGENLDERMCELVDSAFSWVE